MRIVARFEEMGKVFKVFKKVIYYSVMVLVCFEVSLWIIGYRPYSNSDYKVEAQPKNAFVGHPRLGIAANPGGYNIVLNDKIKFHTTHVESGERRVPRLISSPIYPQAAFLGCSFTYGYGVNDQEPFVAVLQREHLIWNFRNYSTPGFGTVQSYLQLQDIVKKKEADVVFLCFSSFHFVRNVMSQEYRSNLKIGFRNSADDVDTRMSSAKFPFIRDSSLKVQWQSWDELYSNYFLRNYLASSNWLQNNVNKFKDRNLNSVGTTFAILKKMRSICAENKVVFKIICLDTTMETKQLQKLWGNGNWLNVNFDFSNKDLTNLPYDSHPNAKGHRFIAEKIEPFLTPTFESFE